MTCTQLTAILIASMMGTGCSAVEQTFKDKPELLKFATRNPFAAAAIGRDDGSRNITSSVIRFSKRLGLDNSKNGDGRGTQENALRHSLWQAAIAARFGENTAQQAGNAYEKNISNRTATEYPDRYSADEAVDLRNNAIGRRIGAAHASDTMDELARKLLQEYHQHGLWLSAPVKEQGKTIWKISLQTLSAEQYENALNKLKQLDSYGMTAKERAKIKK
ncbi:DUF6973 domain-containing protein [Alysiella crassa]|uniref:DUF6973 domain-containing protein n=1 Tax=Alysiella crassa TaxID=153491 RepID=A0A376BM32_9NEIS|nr:hypothetical protein [Alysiella crassa]UOP07113.1 hypothetical protein LVJ80_01165 [Alysiella crassa]SSY70736.1 Uncharacterised protein [Alysiella crassa]